MQLRPYQESAKSAFYRHLEQRDDNPCVVIPTGGGKTPLLASICMDAHKLWQGRVMILAHVRELLEQAVEKLQATDPTLPVGLYSAGLKSRERHMPITVAGIQSVYKRACEFLPFDLILVDEAHLIPTSGDGMYRTFIQEAKIVNPNVRIGGLTATPYRLDVGSICGPENILNEICYEVTVKELIRDGYLCRVKSRAGKESADMSNVHVRAGEFMADEMLAAFDQEALIDSACREVVGLSEGRKGILVFCSGVSHGEHVVEKLRELGHEAGFIEGNTPDEERTRIVADFKSKRLRWLVNVNVLTLGFDAQHVDCVVLLRATLSPGLYYQCVGRGFRIHPDKADCLILDYGTNIVRHGPVDAIRRKKKKGDSGVAPVKECPSCHCLIHASYATCPECGWLFPGREAKHGKEASEAAIISGEIKEEELEVRDVRYAVHQKRGFAPGEAPPTMRVDYHVGWERWSSEWVCFEHKQGTFPRTKAEQWWRARTTLPVPDTVQEAVNIAKAGGLAAPEIITVREVSGERLPKIVKASISEVFEPGDSFAVPSASEFDEMPRIGFDPFGLDQEQPAPSYIAESEIPF